ncbi:Methane/Phenol/Toluene Hydroxylase (plasmid) [Mycolicibacterium chubuense NBB4]|uniref:propane 2-monooxygenase n=1 Tax=Mycolicibacterium chubuense (strain NBB4) TaxID=710421 RepID=D2K2E4_MYCCN|nr:Methane/Phenol/Toluene Hydroxylase [Mycolicibacterium chubuense]ACZ56350.1 putative propene monooxygenase beta subunit [Mycolicibacterium chubuense NBB4]AFM20134.1 Methane/Phenol/Toluene Hydroxylase [Mycolicibacterium chubuense NBB4]
MATQQVVAPDELEGNRTFTWFVPAKRRPTEYELYTVGLQSTPDRWLHVDWPVRFDDGRAPWVEESSAVRSSAWPDYRDPAHVWQRPYVSTTNQDQQALTRLLPVLTADSRTMVSTAWSDDILGRTYAAWPFVEYGLFLSLAYAVRQAMSDTVQFSIVFQAVDRMRLLQDIVHHLDLLHEDSTGFSDSSAREAWMSDSTLVPIREIVEAIATSEDWMEVLVASTLVFEPLVGYLAKSELFSRRAALFGDRATPTVLAPALQDTDRHIKSVQALVRLVTTDGVHGQENHAVIRRWIGQWQTRCDVAARCFLPVLAATGLDEDGCESALNRALANQRIVAEGIGVEI